MLNFKILEVIVVNIHNKRVNIIINSIALGKNVVRFSFVSTKPLKIRQGVKKYKVKSEIDLKSGFLIFSNKKPVAIIRKIGKIILIKII